MPIDHRQHPISALPQNHYVFTQQLAQIRRRTIYVLWIEQLFPAFAPAAILFCLYIFAGLLRIPQSLPDSLRLILLILLIGICCYWTWCRIRHITPPTASSVDRRIEHASHLEHRPLATLEDTPAHIATPVTQAFWDLHQHRVITSLGSLRSGLPSLLPRTKRGQIYFITLPTLLILTIIAVGPTAPWRIVAAFIPGRDDPDVPLPHVEVWITPPPYLSTSSTATLPLFLSKSALIASPITHVNQGAQLHVIVSDLRSAPHLYASYGALSQTLQQLDAHSWKLTANLTQSGTIHLQARGRVLGLWSIDILPDSLPLVQWGENPGAYEGEWQTILPYRASHAYGLSSVTFVLHAPHSSPYNAKSIKTRILTLPVPFTGHPRSIRGILTPDLSTDPWAGQEVSGEIIARSVSGQEGKSPTITFRLGARVFHSPLARHILEIRNRFALGQASRADIIENLETLTQQPTNLLYRHTGMLLNLVNIITTLRDSTINLQTARLTTTNLLWDLAQDIEEHTINTDSSAQASLDIRAVQADIAQELAQLSTLDPHDPQRKLLQADLETHLQALQKAISRKMQTMADQANFPQATPLEKAELSALFSAGNKTFSNLLKQIHSEALNGHPAEALKRLEEIENITEQMQSVTSQNLADLIHQRMVSQQVQKEMADLKNLMTQQMSLLNRVQARQNDHQNIHHQLFDHLPHHKTLTIEESEEGEEGEENMAQQNALRTYNSARAFIEKLFRQEGQEGEKREKGQQGIASPFHVSSPEMSDTDHSDKTPLSQEQPSINAIKKNPLKEKQQATDRRLEQTMQQTLEESTEKLGIEFYSLTRQKPESLPTVRHDMTNACRALSSNDDNLAAQSETNALNALNKTYQEMHAIVHRETTNPQRRFIFSFENALKGSPQRSVSDRSKQDKNNILYHDPLGRQFNENNSRIDDDGTTISDPIVQQKSRKIEQELRRRASDRTRPQEELDYFNRLLKPF